MDWSDTGLGGYSPSRPSFSPDFLLRSNSSQLSSSPSRPKYSSKPTSPSFASKATSPRPASVHSATPLLPSMSTGFSINSAGQITPRSSLDDAPNPPNPSEPDLAKVALRNDLEVLDASRTPQAATAPFSHPHTPPPSPPKQSSTHVKQSLISSGNLAQIKRFFNRKTCSDASLHLHGITDEMLQELDDLEKAGELDGGNVRRSLINRELFLEYPTRIHEFVPRIFTRLAKNGIHLPDGLDTGASTDIPLLTGTKTPDVSIYEVGHAAQGSINADAHAHPTVVFEVAYSQTLRNLSEAAANIIGSSFGAVKLVVAIKLQYNTPSGAPDGLRAQIRTATADYWMMKDVKDLYEYHGPVDCLLPPPPHVRHDPANPTTFRYFLRNDGDNNNNSNDDDENSDHNDGDEDEAEDEDEAIVGAFTCLTITRVKSHVILPEDPSSPTQSLDFRRYQLFRSAPPAGVDTSETLISIPYELIRSVLRDSEAGQAVTDSFKKKKGTKRKRLEMLEAAKRTKRLNTDNGV